MVTDCVYCKKEISDTKYKPIDGYVWVHTQDARIRCEHSNKFGEGTNAQPRTMFYLDYLKEKQ